MAAPGFSTATPPEGTLGCPACHEAPAMSRYNRNNVEEASYALKCVSDRHKMLVIETHRCGSPEAARDCWNEGRA